MFIATTIVSALLAGLLVFSAGRKLTHTDAVVRSYARAGVPARSLRTLAVILLAGAAGLLVGLWREPVGIAAASGLVGYFVIACGFHIHARDLRNLPTPVVMAVLALASLLLRLASS